VTFAVTVAVPPLAATTGGATFTEVTSGAFATVVFLFRGALAEAIGPKKTALVPMRVTAKLAANALEARRTRSGEGHCIDFSSVIVRPDSAVSVAAR
jgi:hypothetical protein